MTARYPPEYFDWLNAVSLASARRIVPVLLELTRPSSVVDVGCGEGVWLSVFEAHGVGDVIGIDGSVGDTRRLQVAPGRFVAGDLTQPIALGRRFDLALSLEVAEHLPASRAEGLVRDLTRLAPVVAFSAAIPGQGGTGHVNEQYQDYWRALFAREGFDAYDAVRARVWDLDDVAFWYAQNLIVYASPSAPSIETLRAARVPAPLSIVHPRLYAPLTQPPSLRQALRQLRTALASAVARRLRGAA
jgi:SAM-dependent methyltransferase